ncbi:MAG: hypothetical protein J3Q66DRAFT_442961 [Benniella sp.]|nr:MAG: hypothetical protein J3Q66DRAFT_442961 [Benniella sp.]
MHFIKKLAYHMNAWEEYEPVHSADSPVVVAPYDQLQELAIHGSPPCSIWKPTHSIQNLVSLSLYRTDIDSSATDVFWGLCTRLTSLVIRDVVIARLPNESMTFERLCKLKLSLASVPVHPLDQQLDWIIRCPKLACLHWTQCGYDNLPVSPAEAFVNCVANGAWPELSELRSTHHFLSDAQFVRIIHGMRQVKVFDMIGCIPELPSFTALRSHFHVLKTLIVTFGPGVGLMVPEILASCPHLEDIVVLQIKSQDILQGRPWVCERSMAHLHLGVFVPSGQDADRHQQLVFERISRLNNLKALTLTGHNLYHLDGTHMCLRLGKGLEQLATLKKLFMLSLVQYTHALPMAEAQWMIDNWTSLRNILSTGNHTLDPQVAATFCMAGVTVDLKPATN